MSKYSLQMECLESIEAFSNEQMTREMAVIESVLEIYDKAILMMELSNKDVDIPDCSMFMESTFFQEVETAPQGQQQQQQQNSNPAQADGSGDNNNSGKNEKVTDNPEEYNKEHHFRKANKEGKLENLFISIIMFIPRLIALPIKLLINFIKKKKNDKAAADAKNATPEEKAKVAEELKKNEGATNNNTTIKNGEITASATINGANGGEQIWMTVDSNTDIGINIDLNATSNGILEATALFVQQYRDPKQALTATQPIAFDFKTVKQRMDDANKAHGERRQKDTIEAFEGKRSQLLQALENRLNELRQSETNLEDCIKVLSAPGALGEYNLQQVINARKTDLNNLKEIIKVVNTKIQELSAIDALTDEIFNVYKGYLDKVKQTPGAVNNSVATDKATLNQDKADIAAGKRPSQAFNMDPVVANSNETFGGENNGEPNNPTDS